MFSRPDHFRDSMVRGAFRELDHDHFFEVHGDLTIMKDVFDFTSPSWNDRCAGREPVTSP